MTADDFKPLTSETEIELGKTYCVRFSEDGPISLMVCTGRDDNSITFSLRPNGWLST